MTPASKRSSVQELRRVIQSAPDLIRYERSPVQMFALWKRMCDVVDAADRIANSPAGNRYGFLPLDNALEALSDELRNQRGL